MKLYGVPASRALRCIWCAEEIGLDYELIPTHFIDESKQPEYLAVNPNGRIPALVDGEVTLFESMAINLYLARTYDGGLQPQTPADEARAIQWSFWAMTELEPELMKVFVHRVMLPEDQRDPEIAAEGEAALDRPLKVLDAHLSERGCLVGDGFGIADLNVISVLGLGSIAQLDLSSFPHVKRWSEAGTARPSFVRARQQAR